MPARTVIELPELSGLTRVSAAELERLLGVFAAARRRVDAGEALLAGEVARRSSLELGAAGLAQSSGDRTPEAYVARVTGTSVREARDLVTVGALAEAAPPWFASVSEGVAAGTLSVGSAAAITTGLGAPTASVSPDALLDAAQELVAVAPSLPSEKVARRARELRDELDAAAVVSREAALRDARWLRLTPLPSGMTRIAGELDPESAALVSDALDCVTAPRRGGPRFVDAEELARVERLEKDPRTIPQLAVDALVEMVRIAGTADPGRVFGVRRPAVRVHVTARDLAAGTGVASVEGQSTGISIASAERLACAGGYQPIVHHPDGTVDVGRTQRLFTDRQRVALAAIWGGCAVEQCDRPPSWTEAHHAEPWSHGGASDLGNGVLLCRHHHMLLHNGGWRISRPPGLGHDGWAMTDGLRRIRLVTKNRTRERVLAER